VTAEKKRVPLFLGEGPDRQEIGYADTELLANGTVICEMFVPGDLTMTAVIPEALRMAPKVNPLFKEEG
jgi:hypothetical protein